MGVAWIRVLSFHCGKFIKLLHNRGVTSVSRSYNQTSQNMRITSGMVRIAPHVVRIHYASVLDAERSSTLKTTKTSLRFTVPWNDLRMSKHVAEASWNVMAHAQKPDFVFRRNGLVHLNRRGRQFSRLLAAEMCVSAVIMLDTPCSEVVWRVLATHSIRQFLLHFPSRASPCTITFQLESTRRPFSVKIITFIYNNV